jgi:hypothetical protein
MKFMKRMIVTGLVLAAWVGGMVGAAGARTQGLGNSANVTVRAGLLRQTVAACWPSSYAEFVGDETRQACRLQLHYLDEHIGDQDPVWP